MSELCMVVVPRHRKPQAGPVLLPRLAMMVFVVVACVFFGGRQSLQGQLQADEGTVVAKSSQSQFKTESQEGKVIAPADQKPKLPVRLLLKGKTEYTLDTGTLSPAEYRKKLEEAAQAGRPLATPAVDLTVEITNVSDKAIQIWTSGDPVRLILKLEGSGALNLTPPLLFTREFRLPKADTLEAGRSISFRITELTSGFRGRSHFAYWSEPGEYKLIAEFSTGIKPPPPGSMEAMDGFGNVQLQSEPLKIIVRKKSVP